MGERNGGGTSTAATAFVRKYWARQWATINPQIEPTRFAARGRGVTEVEVHQTVYDLNGNKLSEKVVGHIFWVEDGLIRRFDIR